MWPIACGLWESVLSGGHIGEMKAVKEGGGVSRRGWIQLDECL